MMSENFQCIIPLATETEQKIVETQNIQTQLKNIQNDKNATLLFASTTKGGTEDKVQEFTIKIKDVSKLFAFFIINRFYFCLGNF